MIKARPRDKLKEFPYELQIFFTLYLSPKDLVFSLQNLSKYWRKYVNDQITWQLMNK